MSTDTQSSQSARARSNNLLIPRSPVKHRENEYDSSGFRVLLEIQSKHFWYRGRHRIIMRAFQREIVRRKLAPSKLSCVDLGGGCGGWIQYLKKQFPEPLGELALADSSSRALMSAEAIVGDDVSRYQIDLLDLKWEQRWDAAFLLDVLEHIPQDAEVLRQIWKSLRPGGFLFVTTPALKFFWSYNDDLAQHVRRYSRADYRQLALQTGFQFCSAHYFMFFLSPLLLLSRLRSPNFARMTEQEIQQHLQHTHRIPSPLINSLLSWIFCLETPLGLNLPFPWGTSILTVLQKPDRSFSD